MRWCGDRPFADLLTRLKCKFCRHKPSQVYLLASSCQTNRVDSHPGWALKLVSRQRPLKYRSVVEGS